MASDSPAKQPALPTPIVAFEVLSVSLLALEVISGAGIAAGSMFSDVVGLAATLGLVIAISRGRSRVGRWIFTLLYALGCALLLYLVWRGLLRPASLTPVAWLLLSASAVQLGLLWSPAATEWLRKPRYQAD